MARLRDSHPWNPGYSIPKNVRDEPYGQGVIVTKQVKRGTISMLQPEWLVDGAGGRANSLGSLGCANGHGSLGGHTLRGNTLKCGANGSLSGTSLSGKGVDVGGAGDPIANFGRQAAALIMSELKFASQADRVPALRVILDNINSSLFDEVAKKTEVFARQLGVTPQAAMEKALAASLAGHYLDQLIKLGKSKQMPSTGVLAMGAACANGYEPVGGIWGAIKTGAGAVGAAAKKVGKGIGNLACKASNSPILQGAAGAAGGPAATIGGALAADSLCGKGGGAAPGGPYAPPPAPFPIMPVLLIVGGLLTVLALRK